jgi:UDP-N-acetylmuramyl-tripeptide synthetase
MEVSSHALYLDRVFGLEFDVVVFTNLSEDHLDFHKTMDEYLASKELILDRLAESSKKQKVAVLNNDLEFTDRLISRSNKLNLKYVTYGITNPSDFQGIDIHFTLSHNDFTTQFNNKKVPLKVPMPGKFNIYNTLSAFATATILGVDTSIIQSGLAKVSVPGRFQLIQSQNGAYIIIDYAHTDDALRNVLNTIRSLSPKKIITVFGCGGDRDRGKRSLMGEVSGKMSDLTIVTSDNPRTEDPSRIIDDIIVGVKKTSGTYLKIENRAEAIRKAIELSEAEEVILIAGKGHEDYQILRDRTIHFDDKEVSESIIRELYG